MGVRPQMINIYLRGYRVVGTQQEWKNEEKMDWGRRWKPSNPTQVIDARMGEEQNNRKHKEEQKK